MRKNDIVIELVLGCERGGRMKRKALYLDDSEKELDALLENEDFWKPGKSEWDSEILDITNKQRELEESQYVKSRSNEAYCYLLSELYPMAEKVAYAQGWDMILNIDEEEHTATLGCCGRFLIKTEGDDGTLENFLSQAMEFSEQCFFSAHNDLIKINFIFNLYEKEKIADHSKEIEALKKQLEDNQEKVREYLLEERVDEYRK